MHSCAAPRTHGVFSYLVLVVLFSHGELDHGDRSQNLHPRCQRQLSESLQAGGQLAVVPSRNGKSQNNSSISTCEYDSVSQAHLCEPFPSSGSCLVIKLVVQTPAAPQNELSTAIYWGSPMDICEKSAVSLLRLRGSRLLHITAE